MGALGGKYCLFPSSYLRKTKMGLRHFPPEPTTSLKASLILGI